ncbi:MAG: beta-ketoacyl-[acyl-carrier-protein] synthase family protein [Acidobacteria bacterium]|nr:beta-ketoacyl-[acyl-carrier-protein] synthase family protein [Acidobacteriota bacterium]
MSCISTGCRYWRLDGAPISRCSATREAVVVPRTTRGNADGTARIAVTGLGVVTPLGTGKQELWAALLAGKVGFAPVESFDTSAFNVHLGAEVRGFSAAPYVRTLDPARLGRASQLAIAASRLALADAGLEDWRQGEQWGVAGERAGVALGTTAGESREIERFDDRYLAGELDAVGGEFMALYPSHMMAAHVARELGLGGVSAMLPAACAAGNYALAHAVDVLRAGRADLMLAGGADAFSRTTFTGFARLGAIAPERCQPFDRRRKGMIPGEGAAMLVLEPVAAARRRGARIYAEVAGYGLSCDAHHMTAAHPEAAGAVRAMERALADAGVQPAEVSYISAHGTGTLSNDRLETMAVERVFGAGTRVPISSVKSMLGHTMGAAAAIEAVVCALAVATGEIPPTVGLEEPEGDLDYVPHAARRLRVDVAMNNAYAFGGSNASTVFAKCDAA